MTDDVGSFSDMLRTALGHRLAADARTFVDMVAEDIVMEFPFTPEGLPKRLQGRDAIASHLTNLGKLIVFERMNISGVHATSDPDTTIVEFEGFGNGVVTGQPYEQQYISKITTSDGRITRYRDYWNPLALLRTLKGPTIDGAISLQDT